jgi:transposase
VAEYSEGFKEAMIAKMTGSEPKSATGLAEEMGVSQSTLSRWLREYGRVGSTPMEGRMEKQPRNWGPEQKLRAVVAYEALEEQQKGKYLREQGLYAVEIERWRRQVLAALEKKPSKGNPESRRVKELERELRRKEKALAETAALLVLKKKLQQIWGDREDGR